MHTVFVFGSNRQGIHGAGAARFAKDYCGAVMGQSRGLQGNSYAIITKELRSSVGPVTLEEVENEIVNFLRFARENYESQFLLTDVGCGLAGFKVSQIKNILIVHSNSIPQNVWLHKNFL